VLVVGLFAGSASAATFTVTSTGDVSDPQAGDGSCGWPKSSPFYAIRSAIYPCTLRAAIEEVNARPPGTGPHTINFSIGFGNQTISLTKALPDITQPVVIDGGTQPVFVRNGLSSILAPCSSGQIRHPCIQLNGSGLETASLLILAAENSTVRWLAIYNYYRSGIIVTGDNDLIEASYIGTDASGVRGPAPQYQGVNVFPLTAFGYSATVTNTVIRNNVISGNYDVGVRLYGEGVRNTQLLDNFIGTTVDGSAALLHLDCGPSDLMSSQMSSRQIGVWITYGASNNVIEHNLISGNCDGVVIDAFGLTDPSSPTTARRTFNQVLGNRIGTNATGTSPVPNQRHGVLISNASSNLVSTTASGTLNQISWNHFGVTIATTIWLDPNYAISASDNKVLGNIVGSAPAEPLGNFIGVYLDGYVAGTEISSNFIAYNSLGIVARSLNMPAPSSQHNFVYNNTVSSNKSSGIWMKPGANGNTIQGNIARYNSLGEIGWDLVDENPYVSSCANTWINNLFFSVYDYYNHNCIH